MHYPVTQATILASISLSLAEICSRYSISSKSNMAFEDVVVPYFLARAPTIWRYPWTILTSAFTGRRPILSVVHITFLALALRFFERLWGSRSLAKYVLLVSLVPVFTAVVVDTIIRSSQPIGGSAPLVIAFLVALKQANPFTYVLMGVEIKPKYLVMPALIFYTAFAFIDLSVTVMAWVSLGVSWWYLRYIKSIVMDQLLEGPQIQKGDQSDSFRFAHFFYPRPLTAVVDKLASIIHDTIGKTLVKNQAAMSDADRQRALGEQILQS